MVVLVGVVARRRALDVFPISIAIAVLLAIVVASYRQTVRSYAELGRRVHRREGEPRQAPEPRRRGGAAHRLRPDRRGLGGRAACFALTSAVSVARAVHELALSLVCVGLIAFANLRGVKEAGILFAIPTYAFVIVDLRR